MSLRLVYITTKDRQQAESIGASLVDRRLAACVNIIAGMTSIYRWQDKIERADEAILIAKTDESRTAALIEAVKALHSYETPCAMVVRVEGGNADYLRWLSDSLG